MKTLCERDNRRVHESLRQLYATRDLDEFPRVVLGCLDELIGSDMTSYNEVCLAEERIVGMVSSTDDTAEQLGEKMAPFLLEHPLIERFSQTRDGSSTAISDLLPRRVWHKTALFNEFFRPLGIEDQMAVGLANEATWIFGIALNRGSRSFSQRDRVVLEILRPHLSQAHSNAAAWSRLQNQNQRCESGISVRIEHEAQQTLEHNRVLVVRDNGRLVFCSEGARRLLSCYFGRVERDAPTAICEWLAANAWRNVERSAMMLTATTFAPLQIRQGHRSLIVRCGERVEGQTLLRLEEVTEASSAPPNVLIVPLMAQGLTRRQSEVLLQLSRGQSNDQIALHLGMSLHTVKRHLEAIYQKMDVDGRGAASHRTRQWLKHEPDSFD